jgi:hypothetical protein
MRYLAMARYSMLTTIRSATPVFIFAMLPPLVAAIAECASERQFLEAADYQLGIRATAAMLGYVLHVALLASAGEVMGTLRAARQADLSELPSDLLDSAPIPPRVRFVGDAMGVFTATMLIHACCLPLLATVAALSPLPTGYFVTIEIATIVLMVLVSASSTWNRLAPRTKFASSRSARTVMLFIICALGTIAMTTNRSTFAESAFGFLAAPSQRAWNAVTAATTDPALMIAGFAILYIAYIGFFYLSATRNAARA